MALPGSPREQVCPSVRHLDQPSPGGDGIEGLHAAGLRREVRALLEEVKVCGRRRCRDGVTTRRSSQPCA